MTTDHVLQALLLIACVGLAFFCITLTRRLRRLNDLEAVWGARSPSWPPRWTVWNGPSARPVTRRPPPANCWRTRSRRRAVNAPSGTCASGSAGRCRAPAANRAPPAQARRGGRCLENPAGAGRPVCPARGRDRSGRARISPRSSRPSQAPPTCWGCTDVPRSRRLGRGAARPGAAHRTLYAGAGSAEGRSGRRRGDAAHPAGPAAGQQGRHQGHSRWDDPGRAHRYRPSDCPTITKPHRGRRHPDQPARRFRGRDPDARPARGRRPHHRCRRAAPGRSC